MNDRTMARCLTLGASVTCSFWLLQNGTATKLYPEENHMRGAFDENTIYKKAEVLCCAVKINLEPSTISHFNLCSLGT